MNGSIEESHQSRTFHFLKQKHCKVKIRILPDGSNVVDYHFSSKSETRSRALTKTQFFRNKVLKYTEGYIL